MARLIDPKTIDRRNLIVGRGSNGRTTLWLKTGERRSPRIGENYLFNRNIMRASTNMRGSFEIIEQVVIDRSKIPVVVNKETDVTTPK